MITIDNLGAAIAHTNFWDSEPAAAGLCFLTENAGAWRLLVPEAAQELLAEMRTGKHVIIEPSLHVPGRCWDVVFEDGSASPYALPVDKRQVDRMLQPGSCRLTVWTQTGKVLDLPCQVNT